jgi:hypothetical protein
MATIADVILTGLRSAQPAATAVAAGTLYHVTDEAIIERSTGSAWATYGGAGLPSKTRQITIVIDGGGSAITTGAKKIYARVPWACTITKAELVADQPGAIVLDVWVDTYANFPPTVLDTITASAKPTLSGPAQKSTDSTLTGWDTAIAAGDYIEVNVDSITTVTRVVLTLTVQLP